jgi:hypothetical protein
MIAVDVFAVSFLNFLYAYAYTHRSQYVRIALASNITALCGVVGKDKTLDIVLPLCTKLMSDDV